MNDFKEISINYWTSIASLKDYADMLGPLALDCDKSNIENAEKIMEEALEILNKHKKQCAEVSESREQAAANSIEDEEEEFILDSDSTHKVMRAIKIQMYSGNRPKLHLLHRSIIVSLVGFYEVLLSDILHIYFLKNPKTLSVGDDKKEEKIFSFNDLVSFSSIEDAINYIIDERVEKFLREPFEYRKAFFLKQLKIDLGKLVPSWDDFIEIFQRRHIIVHNDCRVSKQYLNKVSSEWIKKQGESIELGKCLDINTEYVLIAIETFFIAGLMLVDLCWQKISSAEDSERDIVLQDLIYESLLKKDWSAAEQLCTHGISRGSCTPSSELIFTLNKWLCIKRQEKWTEVKDEIAKFDHSAVHPRFSLVVYSLLEDRENFFKLLPVAVQTGLEKCNLEEWPILDEMRRFDEFHDFIKNNFPSES